eukprot:IDg8562t1
MIAMPKQTILDLPAHRAIIPGFVRVTLVEGNLPQYGRAITRHLKTDTQESASISAHELRALIAFHSTLTRNCMQDTRGRFKMALLTVWLPFQAHA